MNMTRNPTAPIAATLAWEFWARGWRGLLLAPLGALVFPCLIFGMLALQYDTRITQVRHLLQFSFYWMTLILLAPQVLKALGNPLLRYTLPASSFVLVAGPMACAMATIFAQYALVAMTLNALFDAGWPIWGPGLLAAVLVAWCQAVLWSTSNSVGLQGLTCLASLLPLLFVINRWAPGHGRGMGDVLELNGWKVLTFGVATAVCVGAGTFGFARLRHGSVIDVRRMLDWLSDRFQFLRTARATPFSSPASAQFWREWTERGYFLPTGTTAIGVVALVSAWWIPMKDAPDFVGGISGFILAPLSVIGIFCGSRSPLGEFGSFNGSRPLSDDRLASAVLRSTTLGLVSSAVIWAFCMALVVLIVGEHVETSRLYRGVQHLGVYALLARFALGAVAAWSGVGFVTSVALSGRKEMGIAMGPASGLAIAGALLPLCLPSESRPAFTQAYILACLTLCLFGCGAVFVASLRRNLISMRTLALAVTIIVAAVAAVCFSELPRDWKYLALLGGCGLLPIPLAAAPLAVYVNRHR